MAVNTKKGSRKTKPKPRRSAVKKSQPEPAQGLESLQRELVEASEQQAATSEILSIIAGAPGDPQAVLDAIVESTALVCRAEDVSVRLVEGDSTRLVASFGSLPAPEFMPTNQGNPAGRAILQRQAVHVHDLSGAEAEFPGSQEFTKGSGTRTFLSTPMLRERTPIGLINIRRTEVRPLSEKQIALLKTFADQAVIAIENVRLFQELQARTQELARSVGDKIPNPKKNVSRKACLGKVEGTQRRQGT